MAVGLSSRGSAGFEAACAAARRLQQSVSRAAGKHPRLHIDEGYKQHQQVDVRRRTCRRSATAPPSAPSARSRVRRHLRAQCRSCPSGLDAVEPPLLRVSPPLRSSSAPLRRLALKPCTSVAQPASASYGPPRRFLGSVGANHMMPCGTLPPVPLFSSCSRLAPRGRRLRGASQPCFPRCCLRGCAPLGLGLFRTVWRRCSRARPPRSSMARTLSEGSKKVKRARSNSRTATLVTLVNGVIDTASR